MVIAKRNRHLRIGRGNLNVMGNVNLMGLSMAAQNFNSGKKRQQQNNMMTNSFANEMPGNTSLLQLNNAIGDGDDGVREDGIFNTSQLNTSKVLLDTSINLNNSQVMFNKLNESEYLQGESANITMQHPDMSINAGQPIVEVPEEDQANSVHSQSTKQRSDTMTSN